MLGFTQIDCPALHAGAQVLNWYVPESVPLVQTRFSDTHAVPPSGTEDDWYASALALCAMVVPLNVQEAFAGSAPEAEQRI